MKPARTLDVSHLPTYAFGHRSLMWWGTWGLILIEGTVFAMAIVTYFYLRGLSPSWPPGGNPPPLIFGTANLLILLASAIPNEWTKKAAERQDLRRVRAGLLVCIAFAAAFIVVRAFELGAMNVRWDENAYASIVWALLTLHTLHLVTDFADTVVLAAFMFTDRIEGKRFVDVSENSFYWYFVVLSWIPIYATVYLAPRMH